MNKKCAVAVISLHYNSRRLGDLLDKAIESLLETLYQPVHFYFLDNASTDDTYSHISMKYSSSNTTIIRVNKNLGFAGGVNYVFKHLQGSYEYLAFVNSDAIVEKDWLGKLVFVLENNESAIACQPKILRLTDPRYIDNAGMSVSRFWKSYSLGVGPVVQKNSTFEFDKGQYDEVVEAFCVAGTVMLVKSELFRALDGFDQQFFFLSEDFDFGFRSRLSGYKHFVVGNAVAYHKGQASTVNSKIKYFRLRSETQIVLRYVPAPKLFNILSSLIIWQFMSQFVNKANYGPIELLKAWIWNISTIRQVIVIRRRFKPTKKGRLMAYWTKEKGPFRIG